MNRARRQTNTKFFDKINFEDFRCKIRSINNNKEKFMRDVILETQVDYHGPYLRVIYDRCEIIMNCGLLNAGGGCNGPLLSYR